MFFPLLLATAAGLIAKEAAVAKGSSFYVTSANAGTDDAFGYYACSSKEGNKDAGDKWFCSDWYGYDCGVDVSSKCPVCCNPPAGPSEEERAALESQYPAITSGTCESNGMADITSIDNCRKAIELRNLLTSEANYVYSKSTPSTKRVAGCVVSTQKPGNKGYMLTYKQGTVVRQEASEAYVYFCKPNGGSRRGSAEASVGSRRGHYGEHSETAAVESMKSMLQEERKEAMKAKDMVRLIPIRQALQEINQRETDTRMNLDDAGILSILVKMIKERRDSISLYTSAGRVDLADREAKEIQVLQDFVPSGFDSAGETDVGPSKSYKFRKNVVKGIGNGDSGRNWRGEYDFRAAKENQAVVVEPQTYSLAVNFFAVIGFAISAYGAFKHYAGPVHKEHTPLDV